MAIAKVLRTETGERACACGILIASQAHELSERPKLGFRRRVAGRLPSLYSGLSIALPDILLEQSHGEQPLDPVICGALGDLTARKLVPSLYRLDRKKRLPAEAKIVGVLRTAFSDDAFRDKMAKAMQEFSKGDWDAAAWQAFAPRLHYVSADVGKPGGFAPVKAWLEKHEGGKPGRQLTYLAVGPDLYAKIVTNLGQEGMSKEEGDACAG